MPRASHVRGRSSEMKGVAVEPAETRTMCTRSITFLTVFISAVLLAQSCRAVPEESSTQRETTPTSKIITRAISTEAVESFDKENYQNGDENVTAGSSKESKGSVQHNHDRYVCIDDADDDKGSTDSTHGEQGHVDIDSKMSPLHKHLKPNEDPKIIDSSENVDFDTTRKIGKGKINRQHDRRKNICRRLCTHCNGHSCNLINILCHQQCVQAKSGSKVFKHCLNPWKRVDPSKWSELNKLISNDIVTTEENWPIALLKNYLDQSRSKTEKYRGRSGEITHKLSKRELTRSISKREATHQPAKRNMCRSVCTLCDRLGSAGVAAACQRHCVASPMQSQSFEYCLNLWLQNRT